MTYVDGYYDRKEDIIRISERVDGKRILRNYDPEHVFYFADKDGRKLTIFDEPCTKFSSPSSKTFHIKLNEKRAQNIPIYESDINPLFRILAKKYMGAETPILNICFFDIEVDFHPIKAFAPPDDPFNAVTAISLFLTATGALTTLALCPSTLTVEAAQTIVDRFENTILFADEAELLLTFIQLIDDVDVYSGWNSAHYDIPYLVNRVKRIFGDDAAKMFCLWEQEPRERESINKFGKVLKTYDLVGRTHLDYLQLYQKHNPQQQQSYRLDFIGEIEVGENKTPYEGTLDDLYKKDFEKFIEYNRQDVNILVKIDQRKKFIELANQIAHANCVPLKTTMGTVSLVETAIINEMHKLGFVAPDRKIQEAEIDSGPPMDETTDDEDSEESYVKLSADGHTPVVGAYVAKPKSGIHSEIGCVDINSLYPSVIRSLNISPETIVGQVRLTETMELITKRISEGTKRAEAWEGIFASLEVVHMQNRDKEIVTVDFEDGRIIEFTGSELYEYVFNPDNHVCISANGTLFRTDKNGIIPSVLTMWYAERKQMQAKAHEYEMLAANEMDKTTKAGYLAQYMFWNQRQQARKILLNSLYGALLSDSCKFFDERLGQSVTLTGRTIVRHMNANINEIISGKYDYEGDALVACDTDSCYFSADTYAKHLVENPETQSELGMSLDEISMMLGTREDIIALYDAITEATNETFPNFMHSTFNTSLENGAIIRAGRELVGSKALFIKKKKYAILMYDKEGTRLDVDGKPGKMKVMGLDLKRSDTPKIMQEFLSKLLIDILTDASKEQMFADIKAFRIAFKSRPAWEKGSPKKVNGLTKYGDMISSANKISVYDVGKDGKTRLPGHVRASINWNNLCQANNDLYTSKIADGARIIVCKLLQNIMKIDSIAYPVDEPHLPVWFKSLPFDDESMEQAIIDQKIENLVGVLNWDLTKTIDMMGDDIFSFS